LRQNNFILSPNWLLLLLALLAGTLMPTQAVVNNKLATYLPHPALAAFISFASGTLSLIIYILASGISFGQLISAKNAPLVAWSGGLMGAIYVVAVINLVPRLGVALTFSVLIAGNLVITVLLDHIGFLGIPVKPINFPRLLGVLLVLLGVILVRRY